MAFKFEKLRVWELAIDLSLEVNLLTKKISIRREIHFKPTNATCC